jgi:hypothetical protein
LALLEGRKLIESKLWNKVVALCEAADLPIDSEAPDYIIAPTSAPTLGVFHVNHDAEQSDEGEESSGFLPSEEESDDDDESEDGDD